MELCFVRDVKFPEPLDIKINMMPFVMGYPLSIPLEYRGYQGMIDACGLEDGQIGKIGFLSIMERTVAKGASQRRPGIHTEKHPDIKWGGGGWGRGLAANVATREDGLYMASSVDNSCRAWNLRIATPGPMGDCELFRETLEGMPPLRMKAGGLYWMTDACPHESLPIPSDAYRQWFRLVTHKVDLWYEDHSTKNPLGIVPGCKIISGNKFVG